MKLLKNPFIALAGIGFLYGAVVSLVNISNPGTAWYLLIVRFSNLGGTMLFMFIIGILVGASFTLGLIKKAKLSRNQFDEI